MRSVPVKCVVTAIAVLLVVSLRHPASANAEDFSLVSVAGSARASTKDARTAALDSAFVAAVREVVRELVPSSQRNGLSKAIQSEIERRSRLYVASFRVDEENDDGANYRVKVSARIDRAKIREKLVSMGLKEEPNSTDSRPGTSVSGPVVGGFVVVASAAKWAEQAVAKLSERGYAAAAHLGDSGDRAAIAAEAAKRGAAAVVRLTTTAGNAPAIRGTRLVGAQIDIDWEVVDVKSGEVVGHGRSSASGVAMEPESAEAAAFSDALRSVLNETGAELAKRYLPSRGEGGEGISVIVRGFSRYASVDAVTAALAMTPGVTGVTPQQFSRGQISFSVAGSAPAKRLRSTLGGVVLPEGGMEVREQGGAVVVTIAGEPRI